MGMDISSTQIWQDFLTFLKAEKATNPFEEGNKMTAIRKLFQRATENPMHNLEAIWKDYDQFENGLSKILAKALLTEQSPKYMGARVVYRERKLLMEELLRNMLARPPRGKPSSAFPFFFVSCPSLFSWGTGYRIDLQSSPPTLLLPSLRLLAMLLRTRRKMLAFFFITKHPNPPFLLVCSPFIYPIFLQERTRKSTRYACGAACSFSKKQIPKSWTPPPCAPASRLRTTRPCYAYITILTCGWNLLHTRYATGFYYIFCIHMGKHYFLNISIFFLHTPLFLRDS